MNEYTTATLDISTLISLRAADSPHSQDPTSQFCTSPEVTVTTLTHHSICTMLIHSCACTGARSITQEAAFAHLSHSAATYILCHAQCTSNALFTIF